MIFKHHYLPIIRDILIATLIWLCKCKKSQYWCQVLFLNRKAILLSFWPSFSQLLQGNWEALNWVQLVSDYHCEPRRGICTGKGSAHLSMVHTLIYRVFHLQKEKGPKPTLLNRLWNSIWMTSWKWYWHRGQDMFNDEIRLAWQVYVAGLGGFEYI